MKTIFTIILFLLFSTFSFAQYQSLFGEESTSWDMSVWALGILEEFPSLQVYYAGADTIINGNTYKKIAPGYAPPYDNIHTSYLREDRQEGKAWCLRTVGEPEEFLIMDLSLEVGDTFAINDGLHPSENFYPVVDSTYYYEGRKYVRLNFEYNRWNFPGEKLTMIEGVGTNIGTFYQPFPGIQVDYYTLCQTKDGDTLSYVNNSPYYLGRCDVSAVAVNEQENPSFSLDIFPNPADEVIHLKSSHSAVFDADVRVFNQLGQVVFTKEKLVFFTEQSIPITVRDWKAGVYYVQVVVDDSVQILPFVVQ